MIPRTFPSTYASNGQQQMLVHFLTDVTGLQRWSDYIPVKLAQTGTEDSYANNGYIDIAVLSPLTASTQAWKEYIPVYVDDEATDTWTVNATGYIPYGYALFGDASMQLDFTNGAALDSRITFTRSTTATRTNSSGLIESVAINGPRFDYDPVTLAPKGLLIEEQRTNLLVRSEEFQTTWVNERSSEQTDVIISPAGTLTGDKLVEDASATNTHLILQGISGLASGSTLTFTAYIKAAERTSARLQINDGSSLANAVFANYDASTGVASSTQSIGTFTGASSTITPVGNGWYRCSISGVATGVTAVQCRILLLSSGNTSYTGDGTSGIYIWGAQLEAGAFATSYIPTVASQVTRAADNAVMQGANFSSWFNAAEGSLYAEGKSVDSISGTTARRYAEVNDGSTSNIMSIEFRTTTQSRFSVNVSGASQASVTSGGTINQFSKIAGAYAVNNFSFCANGTLGTQDTSGTVPVVSQLSIGNRSDNNAAATINGHIRRIAYFPRRLTDAELQGITS